MNNFLAITDYENCIKVANELLELETTVETYEILTICYYLTNNDSAYIHLKTLMDMREDKAEMYFSTYSSFLAIAYMNKDKLLIDELLGLFTEGRILFNDTDRIIYRMFAVLNRCYINSIRNNIRNDDSWILDNDFQAVAFFFYSYPGFQFSSTNPQANRFYLLVKDYSDLVHGLSIGEIKEYKNLDEFSTLKYGIMTVSQYLNQRDSGDNADYKNDFLSNFLTLVKHTETENFIYIYEDLLSIAASFLRKNGKLDKSIEIIDLILQKAPMDEEKAEYYSFTKTIFMFEKGEYADVIKHLSSFNYTYYPNFEMQFYNYSSKEHLYISDFLLAKSYYQLNEPELAKESYKKGIRFLREQDIYEANYKDILADSLLMKISEVVVKQEPSS
ncbi:MAG: hypothetical protein PHR06_13640 [Candidatus Cloacimonetes bacterium]|nr:hypothetical protein [Candidatus Cloacimonadota bacterium]